LAYSLRDLHTGLVCFFALCLFFARTPMQRNYVGDAARLCALHISRSKLSPTPLYMGANMGKHTEIEGRIFNGLGKVCGMADRIIVG